MAAHTKAAWTASDREQPLEELSVTPQGETKILRGGLLALSPLRLEPRARPRETCRELFDDLRDESVGLRAGEP